MNVKEETTTELATFEEYSSVSDFPEDVNILCHKSCDHYPFLSLSYYSTFERYVLNSQNRKTTYLVIRLGNQPVVMLPVSIYKRLCFSYCESLTNYYFFRYNLFMEQELFTNQSSREVIFAALLKWLSQFSQIDLKPVHADDTQLLTFCDWLDQQGWHLSRTETSANWSAAIPDLDSYYKQLPSQTRNTLKRTGKKLHQLKVEYTIHSDPKAISAHFPDYWAIYRESWKPDETYPEFIEAITQSGGAHYTPLLGLLYIDNTPVAAQLWFLQGSTAYIYKLAYRPDFKHLSVGTNLTWAMIRHCVEQWHIDTLNILNGNEDYKRALFNRQQPVYEIQLHKNRLHTLARALN